MVSPDRRSLSGGSDPEHHHLAHVHGESLSGAVHDVQRHRAQHGHIQRHRVKAAQRHSHAAEGKVSTLLLHSVFLFQGVHLRENVLPAAHGHPAVSVLPEAEAGVRREGRGHQGRDGDRQAGHRLEDQSWGEGEASDESAAKNGMALQINALFVLVFVSSPFFLTQAPGYGDIRLSLEMIPDTVNLEEPFDIICKITNCRYDC